MFAQTTLRTTALEGSIINSNPNATYVYQQDNYTCIPNALADTIIHDLEERKILLIQKELYDYKQEVLTEKVNEFYGKNVEMQSEIIKLRKDADEWKTKATVRGWQRNSFVIAFIASMIFIIK